MHLGFRYILLAALFTGWQASAAEEVKPVRLVITGNLHGYIKACKCPDGQPGGLARRKTIFDRIRIETPDAVFIDCGRLTGEQLDSSEAKLLNGLLQDLEYTNIWPYTPDFANFFMAELEDWIGRTPKTVSRRMMSLQDRLVIVLWNQGSGDEDSLLQIFDPHEIVPDSINDRDTLPDLIIVGGGGYVRPEVVVQEGILTAYPGLFGSHVLVVDLWTVDGRSVSRYEWEAIPTESVLPDSAFQARIDEMYDSSPTPSAPESGNR